MTWRKTEKADDGRAQIASAQENNYNRGYKTKGEKSFTGGEDVKGKQC